jgi:organic hydroperoxide reductase OsmC/OhrA
MAAERTHSSPVSARWESGYRADVRVRDFDLVVDEPERAGGDDTGPMPTEYLLVALSSCYALALGHVARKRDIVTGPFTVEAVGTYEGPSFVAIDVKVSFDGDAPAEIDILLERAARVCYVSNTLARQPAVTFAVS